MLNVKIYELALLFVPKWAGKIMEPKVQVQVARKENSRGQLWYLTRK
jgi:hypothetical protein